MATITSTQSGLWSAGATWVGASVPGNGDDVVIAAGHEVQVDSGVDHSGGGIVLTGIVITGGASPGMLYWKDDAVNGTGNIASSGDISGTNDTNNGRLLASFDGSWATDTELSYTYSAIIAMSSTGDIDCADLDVKLLPDNPTQGYLTPYDAKQDFNAATAVSTANDTITLENHGYSNGDKVGFYAPAGSTLPTPLRDDIFYYVRASVDDGVGGSDDTFKVAYTNSDSTIVDITAVGSGTCSVYTGATTASATLNVFQDVTSDNWTNGDSVVLVNVGPQNYDIQRLTADTINAATVVLSAAPDGQQNPGARIYLSSRNCSITHSSTSTSQSIVKNGSNCEFGEIRATHSSFACYGINSGARHIAITISGCNSGIYSGAGHIATTISGCSFGTLYGVGHTATTISGCNSGINSGAGHTATTISGCSYGINSGSGHTAITISGCNYGIYSGAGHTATTISGCNSGIRYGSGHTATTISGCSFGINSGSHNRISNLSGNTTDFDETYVVYVSGGVVPASPSNGSLNQDGEVSMMFSENHTGSYGTHKIFQSFGNTETVSAGDGSPVPNQRSGGNATLLALNNLQSNLSGAGGSGSADNKIIAWEPGSVRVWATSGVSKTYRFYVQSTFDIAASADLFVRAAYFGSGADTEWDTVDSDETITARNAGDGGGNELDDWTEYIEVAVNPSRTGWIKFDIELRAYSTGGSVYIDPLMVIS